MASVIAFIFAVFERILRTRNSGSEHVDLNNEIIAKATRKNADATVVIMIATVCLFAVNLVQIWLVGRQVDLQGRQLRESLNSARAFIIADTPLISFIDSNDPPGREITVLPVWKNYGVTSTYKLITAAQCLSTPSYNRDVSVVAASNVSVGSVIGSGASSNTGFQRISISLFNDAIAGKSTLFCLYGTSYSDLFGTGYHESQSCWIFRKFQFVDTKPSGAEWDRCPSHNCVDEQCDGESWREQLEAAARRIAHGI